MRRRGCLIALGVFGGLTLLCCVLGWFVLIPRIRDQVADDISEALSTEVANQVASGSGDVQAGTYTISVADLRTELERTLEDDSAQDFDISVDPNGMAISFTSQDQVFSYTGVPVARDGRLVMEDMEVDNAVLGWMMPADRLGDVIEDGVNSYFVANGLEIQAVELGNDEIIITAVDAGT